MSGMNPQQATTAPFGVSDGTLLRSERAVLAALVRGKQPAFLAAQVSSQLNASDFWEEAHGVAFDAFCQLLGRGESPTPSTLNVRLASAFEAHSRRGDLVNGWSGAGHRAETLVNGLFEEKRESEANLQGHVERVLAASVYRSLCVTSGEMRGIAEGKLDPEKPLEAVTERIANLQKLVMGLSERQTGTAAVCQVESEIDAWFERFQAEYDTPAYTLVGYDTGFSDLSRMADVFRPGALIVLSGPSGGGKTALAVTWANNIAQKNRVRSLIISQEMDRDDIMQRQVLSAAMVSYERYRARTLTPEDHEKIHRAKDRIKAHRAEIADEGAMTFARISALARQSHFRGGCRVLFVDYVQMMKAVPRPGQRRDEVLLELANDFKSLAKELKILVVLLAQENQQGGLRESQGLFHAADVVGKIRPYQDPHAKKETEQEQPAPPDIELDAEALLHAETYGVPYELVLEKVRKYGRTGIVRMRFFKPMTAFTPDGPGDEDQF